MKLEGTLDAFGLPDVLQLLGFTHKTGALRLRHGADHGQVLVREGLVCATDATALAHLLLWEDGEFAFDAEAPVPDGAGIGHEELIAQAQAVASGWRAATALLPGDDEPVILIGGLDAPVTLDPQQWALVTRIDGRRPVEDLCDTMEERVALGGLMQRGLVEALRRQAFVTPVTAGPTVVHADEPTAKLPTAPAFTTSVSVPQQPTGTAGGSFEVVGSLAMKPDVLLELAPAPGLHALLLNRLVVAVRGL